MPADRRLKVNFEQISSIDLEYLGVVVLECMNGGPSDNLRNLEEIPKERACNRAFGLENGKRWSGCNSLVDFLDYMFSNSTTASMRLQKPVRTHSVTFRALLIYGF